MSRLSSTGRPRHVSVGATAIHTCHGPRNLSRGAKLLARGAARITHRYVACTGSLVETLRSSGDVPSDKLLVIDNGVDLERFQVDDAQRSETRARLGIPEAAFVIGSVGRLAPEKNYGFLMRAAEPLLSSGAHLLFVGDGSERGRLEAQAAASARPAAVHFAGAQSDVAPFLAAMDVFSLSSTFEGLPLALLEAMASGRTVVASAIGGIPLVVEDGITGLWWPPVTRRALRRLSAASETTRLWRNPWARPDVPGRSDAMACAECWTSTRPFIVRPWPHVQSRRGTCSPLP